MTHLSLTLSLAALVVLIVGAGTVVLLRQRRGRLATNVALSALRQPGSPLLSSSFPVRTQPVTLSPTEPNLARVSGLTLREAEDLLDWLEQHRYEGRGLVCVADDLFAVEFRIDVGQVQSVKLRLQPSPRTPVG